MEWHPWLTNLSEFNPNDPSILEEKKAALEHLNGLRKFSEQETLTPADWEEVFSSSGKLQLIAGKFIVFGQGLSARASGMGADLKSQGIEWWREGDRSFKILLEKYFSLPAESRASLFSSEASKELLPLLEQWEKKQANTSSEVKKCEDLCFGPWAEVWSYTVGLANAELTKLKPSNLKASPEIEWHQKNEAWKSAKPLLMTALNSTLGWKVRDGVQVALERSCAHYRILPKTLKRILDFSFEMLLPRVRTLLQKSLLKGSVDRWQPWDFKTMRTTDSQFEKSTEQTYKELGERLSVSLPSVVQWLDTAQARQIAFLSDASVTTTGYCTLLAEKRLPLIFIQRPQSERDFVRAFAHEMGHAWHYDLIFETYQNPYPFLENIPVPMAETASILFELLSAKKDAQSTQWCFAILWNLFHYQTELGLMHRREKERLTVSSLEEICSEAWSSVLGDAAGAPDTLSWAERIHLHRTDRAFYNYPYLIGFLFSQALCGGLENGTLDEGKLKTFLHRTPLMSCDDAIEFLGGEAQFFETVLKRLDALS